ncbi:hypothetical protein Moror_4973 [Moniliophthora roreri MCA 2997]|uniref:Uncharacterized protein n=1 Tax=Moniliophthora roreri (strain MCA 2997) TaxID=1381753 RepID=V2X1R7_MONRO|nr:hypothetical protein Moror_4973 [Moniliophthora roreri MCA 2997]
MVSEAAGTLLQNRDAWNLVLAHARNEINFVTMEEKLQVLLEGQYLYTDWKQAFDVIFGAETNNELAIAGIQRLMETHLSSSPGMKPKDQTKPNPLQMLQLKVLEKDIMEAVETLQKRK